MYKSGERTKFRNGLSSSEHKTSLALFKLHCLYLIKSPPPKIMIINSNKLKWVQHSSSWSVWCSLHWALWWPSWHQRQMPSTAAAGVASPTSDALKMTLKCWCPQKIAVATSMQQASSAREPYRAIQFHATDVALLITIAMEEAPLTLTAVVAPPLPTARGPQPSQLIDS